MGTIFHILEDEYERLSQAEKVYGAAITKEVKGSPQIKHVGQKDYLYVAARHGAKVVYHYVGEVHSPKAEQAIKSINKRRKYEQLLKEVKADLKEVKKALRGKI